MIHHHLQFVVRVQYYQSLVKYPLKHVEIDKFYLFHFLSEFVFYNFRIQRYNLKYFSSFSLAFNCNSLISSSLGSTAVSSELSSFELSLDELSLSEVVSSTFSTVDVSSFFTSCSSVYSELLLLIHLFLSFLPSNIITIKITIFG